MNDGEQLLRCLVVSTMRDPDVTVYPDADAVEVYAGAPPGGDGDRDVSGYLPRSAGIDYWEEITDADTDTNTDADADTEGESERQSED